MRTRHIEFDGEGDTRNCVDVRGRPSTAQMSDPSSFAGYDFGPNGVWAMPAGATHPVLSWQIGH
ncbi:hypothetical protein C0Z19_18420 [Trinickia soli]|uniref:Uncharacterized protein n=1 Tax=Trinickia soli TaxID=380675 RepID=A0A2N7VW78_9BURK|nr:hypothetical protein CIW54_15645 [Paraburkholderia sp. T12-10]PMS21405.1 hypothetical protein C0Z19_18420 [Trinickia soli]